ncbi:MAG: PDZ domain-containing protein [Sphingobacteriales bacterium]|nr:MAG: PDZ domain-containing protein [Sphingobacteriales bacterium]
MNRLASIGLTIVVAAIVSFASVKLMGGFNGPNNDHGNVQANVLPVAFANERVDSYPDLKEAAAVASPQVVHIKVQVSSRNYPQGVAAVGSGSGVILTADGFIVTNNHVVEGAARIEVVLTDRRTFEGKVIGRDPNTDLALIKIDANNLSFAKIGNSDDVEIGEWVLAIGYPFSLNTTVTAGIISAKERSIGIIGSKQSRTNGTNASTPIEAFIQTDAAINPGNSGGALVNASGELIGINAAIASQTGSYAGYGFAIPINLAGKIVSDLRKYGSVKRGILGVNFPTPATEDEVLKQRGIAPGSIRGVYITGIQPNSAAADAGLREGDIIQRIDGIDVNSSTQLSEKIARHHPEDRISLTYLRNGKALTATTKLKAPAPQPDRDMGSSLSEIYNRLGAKFAPLTDQIKQSYRVSSGMVVTAIAKGGFFEQIGIQPGSIIVSVNGQQINSPMELDKAFTTGVRGTIRIGCITPDGSRVLFNLSLGT